VTAAGISPAPASGLLTLTEAGRILGVTAMTVHRMAVDGLLERADRTPLKNRQVTPASVDRVATDWSRRISTSAAAAMLDVGQDKVRELIRTGLLTRHRYSPHPIAIDEVQRLIDTSLLTDPVHRGRISTREAARQLGLTPSTVSRRARTGRISATQDQHGRWWFKPQHVEMQARAEAAARRRTT
jgi:hypothetical protein